MSTETIHVTRKLWTSLKSIKISCPRIGPVWSSTQPTLAQIYLGVDDVDKAKQVITAWLEHKIDSEEQAAQMDAHKLLMDIAKRTGAFEDYIAHNEQYQSLKDKVFGAETARKVALREKHEEIAAERAIRERERALLYGALPREVADRLIRGEDVSGDHYDDAAVLFMDIAGFTTHSSSLAPHVTTQLLARIFERFDEICASHGVTKIKTIGDSYMAVSFEGAVAAARTAVEMMSSTFSWPDESPVQFRIGLHSGSVVAGVIGKERLQYDVWGDTVNTASPHGEHQRAG